jgi:hypothetical protein
MNRDTGLRVVEAVRSTIRVFFVACIVGAPLAAPQGRFAPAAVLSSFVALEGLVSARARRRPR